MATTAGKKAKRVNKARADAAASQYAGFGVRLRQVRRERKMRAEDLASQLHLNEKNGKQVIWGYEQGRRFPRLEHLVSLSRALGVTLDWLLGERLDHRVAPEIIVRDEKSGLLEQAVVWEEDLVRQRCTAPPLFDSLVLLPELNFWIYEKRRGKSLDADAKRKVIASNAHRRELFTNGKWVARELCSRSEVETFARREGIYASLKEDLGRDLVVEQLERVIELATSVARYQLRFTYLTFRFAYRIYDDQIAVINSLRNYVTMREPRVVREFQAEFDEVWMKYAIEMESVSFLRQMLEVAKSGRNRRRK